MKYRKKPVLIEAYKLPGYGEDIPQSFFVWAEKHGLIYESDRDECLVIQTLEGPMVASPGDWLIKGVLGEFYACKPNIFDLTYELAEPIHQDLPDTMLRFTEYMTVVTIEQFERLKPDFEDETIGFYAIDTAYSYWHPAHGLSSIYLDEKPDWATHVAIMTS